MAYSRGGGPPPELSNNPFIDHPANALSRYPDINGTDDPTGSSQYTSWLSPGASSINSNPTGYIGAGQQTGYGGGYQQQQGYAGSPMGGYPPQGGFNSGYGAPVQSQPTGLPFQPTSSFGQQLAGQINPSYGAQPVPQQQQYSGYPTSPQYGPDYGYPQQQQQQNQYLPEFDPYAPQPSGQSAPGQSNGPQGAQGAYRSPHPREYVRDNKQQLESWDSYAWKQVRSSVARSHYKINDGCLLGHELL